MAIDDQSEPQFLIFQETLPWQPTFFFRNFVFFRHSSKTKRDTHTVPGKENVGNLVFGRMAPSVMTSGDPESQNCFWFYYFSGPICSKSTRPIFVFFLQLVGPPALMIAAKLGCYPARDVATGTNFRHFRTFSVRSGRCFVVVSLHLFDLLYGGASVFNRGSSGSFQGVRGQPPKLDPRRILTKQKYRPYQCCRYRLLGVVLVGI